MLVNGDSKIATFLKDYRIINILFAKLVALASNYEVWGMLGEVPATDNIA